MKRVGTILNLLSSGLCPVWKERIKRENNNYYARCRVLTMNIFYFKQIVLILFYVSPFKTVNVFAPLHWLFHNYIRFLLIHKRIDDNDKVLGTKLALLLRIMCIN